MRRKKTPSMKVAPKLKKKIFLYGPREVRRFAKSFAPRYDDKVTYNRSKMFICY